MSTLDRIKRDLSKHLKSWCDLDTRRQWDLVSMNFSNHHDITAEVWRTSAGNSRISLGTSFLSELVSISEGWGLSRVHSAAEMLVEDVAVLSGRVIFYHELAHVIRGHLYELAQRTGNVRTGFCWRETSNDVPKGCFRLIKWMERDADIVGADLFSMFTALPPVAREKERDRVLLVALSLAAAGLALMYLEYVRQKKPSDTDRVHDEPYLRWLRYIDAMGGALARELKLDDDTLFEGVGLAMEHLGQLAESLGLKSETWRAGDLTGLRLQTNRHLGIVKRYQEGEKRYLDDKSTFLPDVGIDGGMSNTRVSRTQKRLR